MNRMWLLLKLLTVFLVAFSLASLSGPMSSHFQLPTIQPVVGIPQTPCHVTNGVCSDYWVPAGAAEDTFQATIFTDEASEFTNIQSTSPVIDLTDFPLTPDLTVPFTTSSNFQITSTINLAGYYEIQFMLAANFWGCNFSFGNSACGVQIRQGIAHTIDTAEFAAAEPSISGQAAALDDPVPSDNVGGLPTANPCSWDATSPQMGSHCIVGAPGGTAYHLANATGGNGFSWLQAPGSRDLNAAAQHFVNAGLATGFNKSTSVLTGISSAALSNAINIFIENSNRARLDLGNSIAEQICYLFTGSYNIPCGYIVITRAPNQIFPGFTTSTTSVNLSWAMYTATYQNPQGASPFDHSLYSQYNSQFVSGIPFIQPPNGPCSGSAVPTDSAPDYMYLCSPAYDSLTNQMEYANCPTVAGDPVVGSTNNNSTGTCAGGGLSAIGAGVEAENNFGQNAYTLPIFELKGQFGYLNNGWTRVINNSGAGLPNYFTWLNAWNPSPIVPGTIRQGFRQNANSLSPFVDGTVWGSYIEDNIYDSLAATNPLSGGQLIYWSAVNIQQLPNNGLTYTPPAGTVSTYRVTLRSDLFFHDGKKVTSFDLAFSYLALKGTGSFVGAGAAPMTGVTILGPSQFDIGVKSVGAFTLQSLTSLPILPGAYWTSAGSSAWNSAVTGCTATNAPCYPAQYVINTATPTQTICALTCVFPTSDMNVNIGQTAATYDPVTGHTLVGSGAFTCGTVTSSGSGSCTSSGTMNPPVSGSYVLTRFGKGLAPASSISGEYFRSNGNLALWIWSQDNGDFTHDFLNFAVAASCFGMPVTSAAPCAHFQQGIGANGGPNPVGLTQVAIVDRFIGVNWVAPYNWQANPPTGIIPLNPVLYENTITLNPASVAGCSTPYPTGGYDC